MLDGSIALIVSFDNYDEAQTLYDKIKELYPSYKMNLTKQMNNGLILIYIQDKNSFYSRMKKLK